MVEYKCDCGHITDRPMIKGCPEGIFWFCRECCKKHKIAEDTANVQEASP